MPRQSIPSAMLLAQVRRYFDLEQQELGAYLGISWQLVKHIEAGHRTLTSRVLLPAEDLAPLSETELAATAAPPAPY